MPKSVQLPEIYSLYLQFIELEHVYKLSKDPQADQALEDL